MSNVLELKEQLIKKAWEDSEFKKLLLENPRAAVKEALGLDVPENIELIVTEETANKYYLAIPPKPSAEKDPVQVLLPKWN